MAKRKVYRVVTGVELSFSVMVARQRVLITFSGENASFSTVNSEIQKQIEGRADYGRQIKLVSTREVADLKSKFIQTLRPPEVEREALTSDGNDGQAGDNDDTYNLSVINEATDWQEAKDFLRGEPYSVAYQVLTSPEKILAKAAEMGVQFPNLLLEK